LLTLKLLDIECPTSLSLQTASILARIVNCSFLFPSLLICKNASTPYPSRLCISRFPAQYSAYTLLRGNPIPNLKFGGLLLKLDNEESCPDELDGPSPGTPDEAV
jgi:hypothetical protein